MFDQREADVSRCNDLNGPASRLDKGGPQDFMTGNNTVKRVKQGLTVQHTFESQPVGHMVGGAGSLIELIKEPQALLAPGKREYLTPVGGHNGGKYGIFSTCVVALLKSP